MAQLTSNYSSGLSGYNDTSSGSVSIGGGAGGAISGATSGVLAGAALAKAGMVAGPVGMIVGGLLGGLFGGKKTSAPAAPTYAQLMGRNLTAQKGVQGELLNLEGQYRPLYQGLQEQTLNSQLYGGLNNQGYGSMLEESSMYGQGIAGRVGSGYLNTIQGLGQQARAGLGFVGTAQDELNRQASEALMTGGNLNLDQQRQAYQNANASMAMRGLTGRQGVAAGVLANYGMSQDRLNANRSFAQNTVANEAKLQEVQMNLAGSAYGSTDYGKALMAQGNTMLGQYAPQIFNPESNAGFQAQGMKYQEGMALASAKAAQQAGALNSLGMLGATYLQGGFKNLFGADTASTASNLGITSTYNLSQPFTLGSGNYSLLGGGGGIQGNMPSSMQSIRL